MITEEQVVALIAAANPVPNPDLLDPVEPLDHLDRAAAGVDVVADIELDPVAGPRRRSRVDLVAGGLIAAGLVAVLALVGTNTHDSQHAFSPPPEPSAVDVAMGFLAAYRAYDADRALSYLADEAIVENTRTPEEFRLDLATSEAMRYRHTITGCEEVGESPSGVAVRCSFDMHVFGSDEVGLGPYTDNYWDLTVRDGRFTSAVSSWASRTNGFSVERWEPFANWVRANYPDEVLVLYTDDSQTNTVKSEEAVLLLERRVDEFVAEEVARLEPARAFMAAWVAGDGDAAAALLAPDGTGRTSTPSSSQRSTTGTGPLVRSTAATGARCCRCRHWHTSSAPTRSKTT